MLSAGFAGVVGFLDTGDPDAEAAAAFAARGGFAGVEEIFPASAGFAITGFAGAISLLAAANLAFASVALLPRPRACSTEAFKSTSMRSGEPDEYSA